MPEIAIKVAITAVTIVMKVLAINPRTIQTQL
jgi:hypothetical protein